MASCSAPARPCSASPSTLPVSSSAQVEAFTSGELEWPRCAAQSDAPILSSISASMVSVSGTRRSASARHMSATPSRVESPYSARKPCMMEVPARARVVRTRSTARATMDARSAHVSPAVSTHVRTARDSSSRIAARTVARISESRRRRRAMPIPPSMTGRGRTVYPDSDVARTCRLRVFRPATTDGARFRRRSGIAAGGGQSGCSQLRIVAIFTPRSRRRNFEITRNAGGGRTRGREWPSRKASDGGRWFGTRRVRFRLSRSRP